METIDTAIQFIRQYPWPTVAGGAVLSAGSLVASEALRARAIDSLLYRGKPIHLGGDSSRRCYPHGLSTYGFWRFSRGFGRPGNVPQQWKKMTITYIPSGRLPLLAGRYFFLGAALFFAGVTCFAFSQTNQPRH